MIRFLLAVVVVAAALLLPNHQGVAQGRAPGAQPGREEMVQRIQARFQAGSQRSSSWIERRGSPSGMCSPSSGKRGWSSFLGVEPWVRRFVSSCLGTSRKIVRWS